MLKHEIHEEVYLKTLGKVVLITDKGVDFYEGMDAETEILTFREEDIEVRPFRIGELVYVNNLEFRIITFTPNGYLARGVTVPMTKYLTEKDIMPKKKPYKIGDEISTIWDDLVKVVGHTCDGKYECIYHDTRFDKEIFAEEELKPMNLVKITKGFHRGVVGTVCKSYGKFFDIKSNGRTFLAIQKDCVDGHSESNPTKKYGYVTTDVKSLVAFKSYELYKTGDQFYFKDEDVYVPVSVYREAKPKKPLTQLIKNGSTNPETIQ